MANSFSTINNAKVIDSCINALRLGLTPLKVFSLSVGGEPAAKNDTIYVPLVTARTALTNATDYEDAGNTTIAGATISLTEAYSASWHITANQASKTSTNAFEAEAVECINAICYKAQLEALNLVTRTHFGTTTEATYATGSAFDSDAAFAVRNTCLNSLKWRTSQKPSLVLDGAYYTGLMSDPAVKDKSASGSDTAMTGEVPRHAGFDIYENGVIASSTPYGATQYLRGFACLPEAMALAIRPPAVLGMDGFLMNEIVVDAETGIAFNYRVWQQPRSNSLWGAVEILFGGDAVNGSALYRIVSQTSS